MARAQPGSAVTAAAASTCQASASSGSTSGMPSRYAAVSAVDVLVARVGRTDSK